MSLSEYLSRHYEVEISPDKDNTQCKVFNRSGLSGT